MSSDARCPSPCFACSRGERDGLPVVAVINVALAEYANCQEFPWLVELEIEAEEADDCGLPTIEEVERLNAIEERLQTELAPCGAHFVARQTWNRRRLLDYYVGDGPAARERVAALVERGGLGRRVTMKVSRDGDWSTWLPTLAVVSQPPAAGGESDAAEQAVLVRISLAGGEFGSDEEQEAVLALADEVSEAVVESGAGEFDGYEFGDRAAVLFAYGPDADLLCDAIEPVLRAAPVARGAAITKRHGPADDPAAREETVTI